METHSSMTPFGRQSLMLADLASEATTKARPPEKAVNRRSIFRAICKAKARAGGFERALEVLDDLLSFGSETALSCVPSDRQLLMGRRRLWAVGLWRQGVPVDGRSIIRRDDRSRKRYARKNGAGKVGSGFGFDFDNPPLVAHAVELDAWRPGSSPTNAR